MKIRHISILNAARDTNKSGGKAENGYVMRVNLSFNPGDAWKKFFYLQWRRMSEPGAKKVRVKSDELRIMLQSGENIQRYIDSVSKAVTRANIMVERSRECAEAERGPVERQNEGTKSSAEEKRYKLKIT